MLVFMFNVFWMLLGFKDHWETRGFWWNNEMQYCIGNFAAVVSKDGEEIITYEFIHCEDRGEFSNSSSVVGVL